MFRTEKIEKMDEYVYYDKSSLIIITPVETFIKGISVL